MEADTLRLILLLVGIALIFGIYLADRLKKKQPKEPTQDWVNSDQDQPMAEHKEPSWDSLYKEKFDTERANADAEIEQTIEVLQEEEIPEVSEQENIGSVEDRPPKFESDPISEPEPLPEPKQESQPQSGRNIEDTISNELEQLEEIMHEGHGHEVSEEEVDADGVTPKEQMSISFITREIKRQSEPEPKPEITVPNKIIQLTIVPKEGEFYGDDILCVVSEVGMQLGDMNIFHRYADDGDKGSTLFSMASMVEPGIFPVEDIDSFTTPGLTMFANLPGPKDGLSIFSDMLYTAEKLTDLLDGELRDENHSALSKQTIGHIREEIQEHHRQVQLARSKQ